MELNQETNDVLVGMLPGGLVVHASRTLIAQMGFDRVREELVDAHWHRAGFTPPGYYKVRTHPFNDDFVLVKANSQEEAVEKYLQRAKATGGAA